jgi:hypothetical protein
MSAAESTTDLEWAAAAKAVRLAAVVVAVIVVAGLAAIPVANAPEYRHYSLFYEQFVRIEWPGLLLCGAFAIWVIIKSRSSAAPIGDLEAGAELFGREIPTRYLVLGVVLVIWAGVRFVFRGYPFADDEYSALFQAQIFAAGKSAVAVPPEWCPWVSAITPTSIANGGCIWRLGFLPLHSLFRAPFVALGINELGGALTAAASLALVVSISRKVWPSRPQRAWLAALFFATSTQVLFMSMTFFSMPTHLLFSLVWLWLYVDDRRWGVVLLPWVGVLAMGVHSPFPHAYFAFVFLLRYVRERRWLLCAYIGAVYVLGVLFWHGYFNTSMYGDTSGGPVLATASSTVAVARGLFALPGPELQLTAAMHLALMVAWNSPIVAVLVVAAMLRWKTLDRFSRDAALGIVFIILARVFLTHSPQGVGWGYRWVHDAMGTLCMLAAVGVDSLAEAFGRLRARRLLIASVAATLCLQLPLHAAGVVSIIGPYRRASQWFASRPEDVVIVPTEVVAWGRQLLRNDPFFRTRPILVDNKLRAAFNDSMRAQHRSVKIVTGEELQALGLQVWPLAIGGIKLVR